MTTPIHSTPYVGPRNTSGPAMSPEALIASCQESVRAMDSQLSAIGGRIQDRAREGDRISHDIATLNRLQELGRRAGDEGTRFDAGGTLGVDNALNDPTLQALVAAGDRDRVIAFYDTYYGVGPVEAAELADVTMAICEGRTLEEAQAFAAELAPIADGDGGDGLRIEGRDFDSLIAQRKEDLAELNSGNETEMLELQTMVQQRGQIIQMTSNMLRNIDEERDAVIGNLR